MSQKFGRADLPVRPDFDDGKRSDAIVTTVQMTGSARLIGREFCRMLASRIRI
jgi:hypothetical protein